MEVAVVDYGAGNLRSVTRALAAAGGAPRLVRAPEGLAGARLVVVPGVGAFAPAMRRLHAAGLVDALRAVARSGTPLLGLCLGMQLLFDESDEGGQVTEGLGILRGVVRRLPPGVKVPHMGWNTLEIDRPGPLVAGLPDPAYVYFVHSYVVRPADRAVVVAWSTHGERFPAIVRAGSIFGFQFHPEKSSRLGARLLGNLLAGLRARVAP
ncbi:MAG: imidazole glycerol phosphate synthase subunit HisH [Armatimonadota bacterium]|nr:imidazole glycerol phosphate synthase subunit HisH [Armatimonadota bacterium]MDR7532856.1 imidazole glycerol phosphate synthase subunit HisH [Armatimonadota bacterium]MDR7535140.1 imidazole glycerol phosphate synthase subunit HisH [Armatimonadota bacterium]